MNNFKMYICLLGGVLLFKDQLAESRRQKIEEIILISSTGCPNKNTTFFDKA